MNDQQVIRVDEQDNPIGFVEKMEAHQKGLLHRAFSVFIFNAENKMLLQQRALNKYHSPGLWSNACCSHPFPGEETAPAAQRRLSEEMGFTTPLSKVFDFVYAISFDNGLTENEFDHVFVGWFDGPVQINTDEVKDYLFMPMDAIKKNLDSRPELYTGWFHIAFPRVEAWLKQATGING